VILLITLALIQGLTEFIPVSSSGHLVLAQEFFNMDLPGLSLELWLHLATLVAVIGFFWRDILGLFHESISIVLRKPQPFKVMSAPQNLKFVCISVMVTGVLAFIFKDGVEVFFDHANWVLIALLMTGIVLVLTKFIPLGSKENPTGTEAFIYGAIQSIALIPGISRSGLTIATLLVMGFTPKRAFQLSFVASVPLIAIATLSDLSFEFLIQLGLIESLVSFVICALAGIAGIQIVKRTVLLNRFWWFGVYLLILSVACLTLG